MKIYISYKLSSESYIEHFSKMKYNDQDKLIYSEYEGNDVVIIDHYVDYFCHYIPKLVYAKDYFEHVIQTLDKNGII